jgi:TP901 family phage tail tape measure protein
MSNGDFTYTVGGDFSQILRGFAQLETEAGNVGKSIGNELDKGVQEGVASFGKLQQELKRLKAEQIKLPVDSSEYREVEQRIAGVRKAIGDLRRQKLKLDADPAISDLRVLDAAVQGIAFSLSNVVVDSAARAMAALGGLIGDYAKLDTEIRKAAGAAGETGAYERIAATIDKVGIDAAGTTLEVAQLYTELVRGGMSIDQANASLSAIVRGAEATGTSFDTMGRNVSASLKGFGLEAEDATRVVDAMVQGANASASSVEGMGMAFKYAAPVARILGLSIEDLGITVGLLTNAGIDASEAGVTLRNGLSKLASAAPQTGANVQKLSGQAADAARAMRTLGVDIYNADGTLKPMQETLLQLKGAFDKLAPAAKIRLAASLFGGEDDGTKWLALLNQSEEEIKKMSATMANTKGATDTARDAMQGFELLMKQLDGTIGSINNTLAGTAATALLPLINAANAAVGAIALLPGPIKQTAAAAILLSGGLIAARTSALLFQQAMNAAAVREAAQGILQLGGALRGRLAADLAFATAAWGRMAMAVVAFDRASISIPSVAMAVKASLVGAATAGTTAFKGLTATVTSGALLQGLQAITYSARAAIAGYLPLIIAFAKLSAGVAALAGAYLLWKGTMQGADQVSEGLESTNKSVDESIAKLGDSFGEQTVAVVKTRNAFQELYRAQTEGNALNRLGKEMDSLQAKFDDTTDRAVFFYTQLKGSGSISAEQVEQAKKMASALDVQAKAARNVASSYRVQADAESAKGNETQAQVLRIRANQLEVTARVQGNLAESTRTLTGLTKAQTEAVVNAEEAERRRLGTAKLQVAQQEVRIARRREEGQITAEQAREEERLLELRAAQAELEVQRGKVQTGGGAGGQAELNARQRVAELEKRIAELKVQGTENALRNSQREYDIAVETLNIARTRLDLETQASGLIASRIRAQQDYNSAQLNYQSAYNDLVQSEFNVDLARQNYAIQAAEEQLRLMRDRGASVGAIRDQEQFIASLRGGRDNIEKNKLAAEIAGAEQRFAIEQRMLQLKQAQQVIEAQSAISAARQNVIQQEIRLLELKSKAADPDLELGQRAALQEAIDLQRVAIGLSREQEGAARGRLQMLGSIFDLENRTLSAQQQTTANGYRAEAAARGWEGALQGPLKNLDDAARATGFLTSQFREVVTGFIQASGQTVFIRDTVVEIGLASGEAAVAAGSLAGGYANANVEAKALLDTLQKLAATKPARWAGGPVDPSVAYQVNELGQESFLSPGGMLSLIHAPARGTWRPPARGTVLPAGVTAGLKAQGAFGGPPAAISGGVSAAGDAIGNLGQAVRELRAEVRELRMKTWTTEVRVPGSSAILGAIGGLS